MSYQGRAHRKQVWWNRGRVLVGLKHFYEDFNLLPTSAKPYNESKAFTGRLKPNGQPSTQGHHSRYPGYACIANHFGGMREAWVAVAMQFPDLGINIDRNSQPWTKDEDRLIIDTVGIHPRSHVAKLTKRSEQAIKRRLYDLGINAYDRWGWTVYHSARVLNLQPRRLLRYIREGKLPFLQGHKCIYLDPCDLPLLVQEYDWKRRQYPPELTRALEHFFALRICCLSLHLDWAIMKYHHISPLEPLR